MDTKEYVILPIKIASLGVLDKKPLAGRYGWNGSNELVHEARLLGIYDTETKSGPGYIEVKYACPGWGFGHIYTGSNAQGYGWNGKQIQKTVFEIAVTSNPLTPAEQEHLLK